MIPTPQQQAAIDSNHPFILVLCGPGGGKSSTLLARIERLIREGQDPSGIVCITYTNDAAKTLADRLEFSQGFQTFINRPPGEPTEEHVSRPMLGYLGTLHGFALQQLQRHGAPLGYGERITVLDQEQADEMLLSVAGEMGAKGGLKKLQEARESLRAGRKPRTPQEIAVAAYLKRLRASSACDFDMILTDYLSIEKWYKNKDGSSCWDHLLVDEIQDAADIDWEIYEAICVTNRFFVGDPDQQIFSFRNPGGGSEKLSRVAITASLTNTESSFAGREVEPSCVVDWVKEPNPLTELHILEGNFRCGSAICESANHLIGHNRNRVEKSTRAMREVTGKVVITVPFGTDDEERWAVIQAVIRAIERGADPNEIAILSRGNALAHEMAKEAEARGIPVRKKKAVALPADWAKARAALDYLNAPQKDLTARQWLKAYYGATLTREYERDAALKQIPLWQAMPLEARVKETVTPANYLPWLRRLGISRESVELIAEKAAGIPNPDLAAISCALARDMDAAPEEGHGVTITTMHSMKGREAKTVFLVGVEDEIIPGHRNGTDFCEERRVLYVGITRAKDELYISHCAQRKQTWGDQRLAPAMPSRFLFELGL